MKPKSTATSRRKASSSTAKRGQPSARSPSPPTAPPPVPIVFVAGRGRARLHVAGIRGRSAFAARLQARLAGTHGVRQAHASATTGNVLVLFDAAKIDLRSLITAVVSHAAAARNGDAQALTRVDGVWHTLSASDVVRRLRADPSGGRDPPQAPRAPTGLARHRPPP